MNLSPASPPSLQERYAPENRCFGCGPANELGLRIRSFETGESLDDEVVCDWTPQPHHEAFAGVLNGGIIASLLDCHGNWTAMRYILRRDGLDRPPPCVTARLDMRLLRPTDSSAPLHLSGRVLSSEGSRVEVEARVRSGGVITAVAVGTFVAVGPGHPAYDRW